MKIEEGTLKIEEGTLKTEQRLWGIKVTFETKDFDAVNDLIQHIGKQPMKAEIKPIRQKRSLDANSYFWTLADKLGDKLGLTKEEVYREMIHDVGVFEDICIMKEGVETFCKCFENKGTGWIAEVQPDCKIKGCAKVRCFYGSSTYDQKQMSRLIDLVIYECKQQGIPTDTPEEIERIKALWKSK